MGFVTLRGVRTNGAFGLFNRSTVETGERLDKAFRKAKELVLQQSCPTTRKFPLNNLRRLFSNILGLDVIYSPKLKMVAKSSQNPRSRVPSFYNWEVTPVWRCAPRGAVRKSERLASLLHEIAVDGWKANLAHDLVRLAINVWQMPMTAFDGLCRKIRYKIGKATQSVAELKSPETALKFSFLSANPTINCGCVSRYENRSRRKRLGCVTLTSRLSYDLGLRASQLHTMWYTAHARKIGLRQPT